MLFRLAKHLHGYRVAVWLILWVGGALAGCRQAEPPNQSGQNSPAAGLVTTEGLQGGKAAYAHTVNLLSYGPRPPSSPALRQAQKYLARQLESYGWVVVGERFTQRTPLGRIQFVNLIARYPHGEGETQPHDSAENAPAALWQEPVTGLLCAHLDSKYYPPPNHFLGADDAASACALLLELARHLATAKPEQASQLELVFFDGEEGFRTQMSPTDGIYGSRHYASQRRALRPKPTFGILLDMIGHKDLSYRIPANSPAHLVELFSQVARQLGHQDRVHTEGPAILDDHVPLNQIGIPTIDLIGDFANTNWWHTTRDNLDLISEESLQITFDLVTAMLDELLTPASNQ